MTAKTYCTTCFKSLGVPARMEIFRYLAEKKVSSVGDIVEYVGLTQPTVSYHLNEMKKSGIVEGEKRGKEVYYRVRRMCPHEERLCVLKNINLVIGTGGSYAQ